MPKEQEIKTLDWNAITPLPEKKCEPACAVVDGKWYVFGGYTVSIVWWLHARYRLHY
jgi:hypothetical protein